MRGDEWMQLLRTRCAAMHDAPTCRSHIGICSGRCRGWPGWTPCQRRTRRNQRTLPLVLKPPDKRRKGRRAGGTPRLLCDEDFALHQRVRAVMTARTRCIKGLLKAVTAGQYLRSQAAVASDRDLRQAEGMHSENSCALFAVKQAREKPIFRPACLLLALTGERSLRRTGLPVMTVKPLGFKSPVTVVK